MSAEVVDVAAVDAEAVDAEAVETVATAKTETADAKAVDAEAADAKVGAPATPRPRPGGVRRRPARVTPAPAEDEPDRDEPTDIEDSKDSEDSKDGGRRSRTTRVAVLVVLVLVTVAAVVAAAYFRNEGGALTGSPAASNDALVDVAATSQVNGQVADALEQVFSYDYARLDENEQAAQRVVTGRFAEQFPEQFADVRELAPQQQAVVVATVVDIAVRELDGDRAIVFAFLDQQATRGTGVQPIAITRLTVTAQRVNGQWKIENIESL